LLDGRCTTSPHCWSPSAGRSSAAPASRCRAACARTGSPRRYGSTASPWCPTPGRCCVTSSTIRHLCCTAIIRCGCSSLGYADRAVAARRRCVRAGSRRRVLRHHRRTSGAGQRVRRQDRQQGPAAARRRTCRARCYDTEHDLILEDERGFVQVADVNQVGVLLAQSNGPIDPTASVKRGCSHLATPGYPRSTCSAATRTGLLV